MLPYIYVISFCLLLIWLAETAKSRSCILFWIMSFFALSILAIFSGVRDVSVGYDVTYYLLPDFYEVKYSNSYEDLLEISSNEYLYLACQYFVSNYLGGFNIVMGVVSFIILFCTYLACVILSNKTTAPIWLLFTVFLFFNYSATHNLIRQYLAFSIVFLGFSLFYKQAKWYIVACLLLIAIGFHKSSVLPFLLFFFTMYVLRKKANVQKILFIVYTLGCVFIYYGLMFIMEWLGQGDSFFVKYVGYVTNAERWGAGQTPIWLLFVAFSCIIVCVWMIYKKCINRIDIVIWGVFIVANLLSLFLANYNSTVGRLALYFNLPCCFFLVKYLNSNIFSRRTRIFFVSLLLCYSFVYFVYTFEYSHLTYTSEILGIE